MKIVLINAPVRLDAPPNVFPIGLGSIAATLLKDGHQVDVVDANAWRLDAKRTIALTKDLSPDLIGISGLITTYNYQRELIMGLKASLPHAIIISGGGCASAVPHLLFEHAPLDVAVLGEGEHSISELAFAIEQGSALDQVAGIALPPTMPGAHPIFTQPRTLEKNLDYFPSPAHELFPLEKYLENSIWNKKRAAAIVSSRGCPMACHFCYSLFGRRSYRKRSVDAIMDEVRLLKYKYGARFIAFVDDNLTINKRHLFALCEALAKENIAWGCHGRVDTADDERLAVMAESGCEWLGFGIESGSPRILNAMNKQATPEKAKDAIMRTRKHGIFANTTFIFGYPGEDEESIRETQRFKIDLNLLTRDFFATPYPGTELYHQARGKGLIEDEHEYVKKLGDATDFLVNLTNFSDDRLFEIYHQCAKELKLAIAFRAHAEDHLDPQSFAHSSEELLRSDFFLTDVKGYILQSTARYYRKQGQSNLANKLNQIARDYLPRKEAHPIQPRI